MIETKMQVKKTRLQSLESSNVEDKAFPAEILRKKKVKFTRDCGHDNSMKM